MVCSRLHKKRFRGAAALTAASAASQLLPLLVYCRSNQAKFQ